MVTHVFKVPDRDLQALVTVYDDGACTLAFRPGYGTWGPPIQSMSERQPLTDLDTGDRPLPESMTVPVVCTAGHQHATVSQARACYGDTGAPAPDAHLDLDMEDRLGGGLADVEVPE